MPTLVGAIEIIRKIFTDFGQISMGPLDSISMVGIGVGLSLLIVKEIKEEYFSNRIRILDYSLIKWIFYVIVACYTLAMGVLDAGQFIYVAF